MTTTVEHYQYGTISLFEFDEGHGPFFVVSDPGHFRVTFHPDPVHNTFTVGIDAEWSDDCPEQLAHFTPPYQDGYDEYRPGDITVSDEGLLSVMATKAAARILIRRGWTAQMPRDAVEPMRRAISMAEAQTTASIA